MKIELIAAVTGTVMTVGGSAFVGYLQANTEARESIIRLSTAAEAISEQVGLMREEMKQDRQKVTDLIVDHHARLRVLESQR